MNPDRVTPLRLTRDQVRRVDRLAIVKYHVSGLVLMENAGRNAAHIIHRECAVVRTATVVCGVGNNGGDGLVIARHLHNVGWKVRVIVVGDPSRMTPDTAANYKILGAMNLPQCVTTDWMECHAFLSSGPEGEVVVDALLGTGFSGAVRPPIDGAIRAILMTRPRTVVSIDVPSGLDADTGFRGSAIVKADFTITFVAEKVGFDSGEAQLFLGRVFVADIGAPVELIEEALSGTESA
ncbi:MAG: NAD(P)H-hydrate epimerase [Phycisphaerales bacterium]|nr:NAD(P)H-hydrate epimerase [Phycisphaerales bacterium]